MSSSVVTQHLDAIVISQNIDTEEALKTLFSEISGGKRIEDRRSSPRISIYNHLDNMEPEAVMALYSNVISLIHPIAIDMNAQAFSMIMNSARDTTLDMVNLVAPDMYEDVKDDLKSVMTDFKHRVMAVGPSPPVSRSIRKFASTVMFSLVITGIIILILSVFSIGSYQQDLKYNQRAAIMVIENQAKQLIDEQAVITQLTLLPEKKKEGGGGWLGGLFGSGRKRDDDSVAIYHQETLYTGNLGTVVAIPDALQDEQGLRDVKIIVSSLELSNKVDESISSYRAIIENGLYNLVSTTDKSLKYFNRFLSPIRTSILANALTSVSAGVSAGVTTGLSVLQNTKSPITAIHKGATVVSGVIPTLVVSVPEFMANAPELKNIVSASERNVATKRKDAGVDDDKIAQTAKRNSQILTTSLYGIVLAILASSSILSAASQPFFVLILIMANVFQMIVDRNSQIVSLSPMVFAVLQTLWKIGKKAEQKMMIRA